MVIIRKFQSKYEEVMILKIYFDERNNIASSHQIFQKCQIFLIFCVGNLYFLINLMGTCNNNKNIKIQKKN
jgi:hypothetical protein